MQRTLAGLLERLVSGKAAYAFDFVNNPIFFVPQPDLTQKKGKDAYLDLLRGQTVFANLNATLATEGVDFIFIPGAMSTGYDAYAVAKEFENKIRQNNKNRTGEDFLSVQRMKHSVPGQVMMERVILPARLQNQLYATKAGALFPDMAVVAPVDFEGTLRMSNGNSDVMQGASYQDWTFEAWWVTQVIRSSSMYLEGDHAYSRYGQMEELVGDQIQCGLLDDIRAELGKAPGRTYDIVDEYGEDVPLADRAWETAKHIVDVVEQGFRTDLAVASLIVKFTLDDQLRDENSGLDRARVHPFLLNRTPAELQRMDDLKKIMLPYIAQKCASWMPYAKHPGLNDYFEKHILPLKKPLSQAAVKKLQKTLFAYQPRGGFVHPVSGAGRRESAPPALKSSFMSGARAKAKGPLPSDYFKTQPKIFDDRRFHKLQPRFKAALPLIQAAAEFIRLPLNKPDSAFLVCPPKGGELSRVFAAKNGARWTKEAQNIAGFEEEVIKPNWAKGAEAARMIPREDAMTDRGIKNVHSTQGSYTSRDYLAENKAIIAIDGTERLDSNAILTADEEKLVRLASATVLLPGWENHPYSVQMMFKAVQVATGQIERPWDGGECRMEIFVFNQDAEKPEERWVKQDLHSLIATLGKDVEDKLSQRPPVPDRASYLTCARMLEIADKLADPGRRNYDIVQNEATTRYTKFDNVQIEWGKVDPEFWGFWKNDPAKRADLSHAQTGAPSLRDRLMTKLKRVGVLQFSADDCIGLQPEYKAAWDDAFNEDGTLRQVKRTGAVQLKHAR